MKLRLDLLADRLLVRLARPRERRREALRFHHARASSRTAPTRRRTHARTHRAAPTRARRPCRDSPRAPSPSATGTRSSYKPSQRDRRIFDEFRGDNHGELARKYGVSIQWIYKIIKAVGREEAAARQKQLFSG
ncbi:Mor transcription activator family protein [Burkholderia oklahomensis]|uniref:Mor transcription activator family protein n=1 Tax=Burkholderia oklahomensis TaxID=342113 RepID=UPI001F18DD32|nr:Mor transcription activator family protein [Burkholderia oklahomensis]